MKKIMIVLLALVTDIAHSEHNECCDNLGYYAPLFYHPLPGQPAAFVMVHPYYQNNGALVLSHYTRKVISPITYNQFVPTVDYYWGPPTCGGSRFITTTPATTKAQVKPVAIKSD